MKKTEKDQGGKYAHIVFPLPLEMEFAYLIPSEIQNSISIGSLVSAPFRNSIKTGVVTGFTNEPPPGKARELQDILLEYAAFSSELISLAGWMGRYYFTSLGEILQLMMPVKLNRDSVELITLSEKGENITSVQWKSLTAAERNILDIIKSREKVTPDILKQQVGYFQLYYRLDRLRRSGYIVSEHKQKELKTGPRTRLYVKPQISLSEKKQDEVFGRAFVQRELYKYILESAPVSRSLLLKRFPGKEGALNSLFEKKLVEKFLKEEMREYDPEAPMKRTELPDLKPDQRKAVSAIGKRDKFSPFLLHGVTGSGKTRVYFELLHRALDEEKGGLFLVPEIALTNYFLSSLREQFGEKVAVLHSRMSAGERYDSWRGLLSGKKRIAIGPRSAVFAPVKDLGIIIVDEEHDASYKQHESPPYYNARDVAVYRANLVKCPVILGSATPSMETFYNAETGKYGLLELPERIDNTPMPEVKIVDMREKKNRTSSPVFSPELLLGLEEHVKRDEQVLLMLNRRGYSTFIQCFDCGYIEECPDCNITLTFHKNSNRMRCHFCGFTRKTVSLCPECRGSNIRFSGYGTQQVEETLLGLLPGFKTSRMDQDTTRSKSAHRKLTSQFERGESDIMVGTQMIAKGFDFARVNLVGVVSADTGLLVPEFRAAERTFQLMTQAAGRAGRRKERGRVLIQSLQKDHYSLAAAKNHDFRQFYDKETEIRAELKYPPHGRIILLRFFCEDENQVVNAAGEVGRILRKSKYRNYILGPAPAPIEKIRRMFRWFIFLKSGKSEDRNGSKIRAAAKLAREHFNNSAFKKQVAMTIDVDPVNLL